MSECYKCGVKLVKNYHPYGIDCTCPKQGYKIYYGYTVDPDNCTAANDSAVITIEELIPVTTC